MNAGWLSHGKAVAEAVGLHGKTYAYLKKNKLFNFLLPLEHSVTEYAHSFVLDALYFTIALPLLLQLSNTWLQLLGADEGTHLWEYLLYVWGLFSELLSFLCHESWHEANALTRYLWKKPLPTNCPSTSHALKMEYIREHRIRKFLFWLKSRVGFVLQQNGSWFRGLDRRKSLPPYFPCIVRSHGQSWVYQS